LVPAPPGLFLPRLWPPPRWATQWFLEPRLGFDLSGVRIHADDEAAVMARSHHAQAFTIGRDVVFGAGRYDPGTAVGRWLIAHELTHVLQRHNPASSLHEAEAEAREVATTVSSGRSARVSKGVTPGSLHRFGEPENVPDLPTYADERDDAGAAQGRREFQPGPGGAPPRRCAADHQRITSAGSRRSHLIDFEDRRPDGRGDP
jgi:Domain of unknown function (DUF4157)